MFTSTQWQLVEEEGKLLVMRSPDGSVELEVLKRFEFDHHWMSMSVVMKHRSTGKVYVFCKGSYEKMQTLSVGASVPSQYKSVAESLAKKGCYVLGVTHKELNHLSDDELHALLTNRDAMEELLGLIMFRNELKEDSRDAILNLKNGDTRVVVITGDNEMTGCYIARASGMIADDAQVIIGDMVADKTGVKSLVWTDVDTETIFSNDEVRGMAIGKDAGVELAVTWPAFDYLVKMDLIKHLLFNIRIFSRMTPGGKVECVKLHMAVTGMCGDGGNDCGALRIAHVGVALSEAEASVVEDLVREGRCSLATSFASVSF